MAERKVDVAIIGAGTAGWRPIAGCASTPAGWC